MQFEWARICGLYLADDLSFKKSYKMVDNKLPEVLRFLISHTGRQSGMIERLQAMIHIARNRGEIARELIDTRCQRGAEIARASPQHDPGQEWTAGRR